MEEYRSNSDRSKEQPQNLPQRRAEKVITGSATQRKKNGLEKFGSVFLASDFSEVKDYILRDVLIPTIKRGFYDIICNGIGMLLGERSPSKSSQAGRVSYRSYYDRPEERKTNNNTRARANYSYNDLIFDNRGDAEVVLERMYELLERFDAVSIADLFDLAGESCQYTDYKYGWTNLDDARVQPVRNGYIIQLPRATTL